MRVPVYKGSDKWPGRELAYYVEIDYLTEEPMADDIMTMEQIKAALHESGIMRRPDWYLFVSTKDWGRSISVRIGRQRGLFLIEQYYDTDENGEMIKYHGEIRVNRSQLTNAIEKMLVYANTIPVGGSTLL